MMLGVPRGFEDRALRVILIPDDCLVREDLLSLDHRNDEISRSLMGQLNRIRRVEMA
jgi:hypothetical protein